MKLRSLLNEMNMKNLDWFHGTKSDFEKFDIAHFGKTDEGWFGKGIYFYSQPDGGGYGNIVKKVKLKFQNPLILPVDYSGRFLFDILKQEIQLDSDLKNKSVQSIIKEIGPDKFSELCKRLGYDALIVQYVQETKECVVFDDSIIDIIDQNINKK